MTKRRGILFATVVTVVAATGAAAALAGHKDDGFKTTRPQMLTTVPEDKLGMGGTVEIEPLLTVGDELPGGYRFEAIPDGIALDPKGKDVDVWVNHETSKAPFPFVNTATDSPTAANGENDFDNAQLSHLVLDDKTAGVLSGEFAIPSSAGFQRFCSNFLATKEQGFDRDILFISEESPDYFLRQEASWPPAIGAAAQKEAGVVVALDVKKGTYHPIYGMGRHNHENAVAIPGFKDNVVLSGDDTFTSGPLTLTDPAFPTGVFAPAQSQLYSYIAKDTKKLLKDEGKLWAFVSDDLGYDDYYDFTPGSTHDVSGHFIEVPKIIATGIHPVTGAELKSTDMAGLGFGPYPLPPDNGSWQRDPRVSTSTSTSTIAGSGIDGPQWVLEYWSDSNNVFQFVRVEDIAYDKRKHMENVVYVVDSGRGTTGAIAAGKSTNGRVWKMVLDEKDPTVVTSLSIIVEGDDSQVKTRAEVHQPDNIETTKHGLLLTEDPGSSQQFTAAEQVSDAERATTGRLWYVPFSGTPEVVVSVDQSSDGDAGYDVDGRPDGRWGAWETTGIVDASKAFGKDMFLINVQAHSLWVDSAPGTDNFAPPGPDFTNKREGGQLLLIKIPGIN